MDGWMDGWIDAWMQGCMDAWMHGDACSDQGNDDHKKSAATKTTKSTFRCCEFWGAAGTEQWFSRFRGCTFHVEGTKFPNLPPILPKTTQNSKIFENPPKNRKNPSKPLKIHKFV